MTSFIVIATFLLFNTWSINAQGQPKTLRTTGISGVEVNEYVDKVVTLLKERLVQYSLEPFPLPNKILALTSEDDKNVFQLGIASLTQGSVRGLQTLHRVGDAKISYYNPVVALSGTFGVPHLEFEYSYKLSMLNFGPQGFVRVLTFDALLNFTMSIDITTLYTNLDKFDIEHTGYSKVSITGVGSVFDAMVRVISSLILKFCETEVLALLEPHVTSLIEQTLRNITMPPAKLVS